jgi:glycosyltransferase involved in cell wall biosynthesis
MIALCYSHALGEGGYPRDLRWLATALYELGLPVALCTNPRGEQTREGLHPSIPIWDLDCLKERAESIYCAHFFGIFIPNQMKCMEALREIGVPLIVSPWAQLLPLALEKSKWKKKLFLARYSGLFRKVSAWSVFSETEWRSVKECFGNVLGERVFGGLGHYPEARIQASNPPRELSSRFEILFFGRCDIWQKGIDILLESYSVLGAICDLHRIQRPVLTIAGNSFGKSESHIGKRIRDFPTGDVVRLRNIDEEEIDQLFLKSDLFVYLSRFDGPPRPVRRAIERGVPVLVSLESNMSEEIALLTAGTTTTLRPDAVAARIFEIMRLPLSTRDSKRRSYPDASTEWTWSVVARHHSQVYHPFLPQSPNIEAHLSELP